MGGNFSTTIPNKLTVYDPNDIARTTIKETTIHNEHDGNLNDTFTDVLLGHFHRVDMYDIGTGSAWICGTMKGGDEFSINRLHTLSAPKQVITYWHPVYGNVGRRVKSCHHSRAL